MQAKFLTVPDIAFILARREAERLQMNAGFCNVGIYRMKRSMNAKKASLILLRRAAAALLIGLITGFSVFLYLRLLELSITQGFRIRPAALLLPLSLFLSRYLIMKVSGGEPLRGNNKFFKAINIAFEKKSYPAVLVNLLASIMTIAFGGSAGRAGPSAQIGSALSRKFSDTLRLDEEDRLLMKLCGISAGFAAVLGAPLAGIVLSLEIMKPRKRSISTLLSIGISAFASTAVGSLLPYSSILLPYSSILLPYSSHHIPMDPQFSVTLLFQALLGGLFFAAVGLLLMWSLKRVEQLFQAVKLYAPLKAAIGGVILILFGQLVSQDYLGLGQSVINRLLSGETGHPFGFACKILTTSVTLGSGGTGGIFSPIFFVGASAGSTFGALIGSDPGLFAALGLVSVLSAAVNAPVAAVLLSAELFGFATVPAAVVVSAVGYLITKYRKFPNSLLLFSEQADSGEPTVSDKE